MPFASSKFPSALVPSLFLLLFLPIIFYFFVPQILPPKHIQITLDDELDDLALFRRATVASTRSSSSISRLGTTNPRPKIAFLFLTNSNITFAPLWEKFFHGSKHLHNIYIHADPTTKLTPPGGVFEGRFIPAKRTERGSPTLISAARRLLANAIIDDRMNLYFALVSQHCIPLYSFHFVYKSLFGDQIAALKSFANQRKYQSFIEISSDKPYLPKRYVARGENVMLPEVPYDQFRVGSQFYILTKRHAMLVIKDSKLWRKFKLPCFDISSCYPEEHYFPTLLSMEDPEGCSHYTLTRVNWTGSTGGHPYTYKATEVSPLLIHELRDSNSSYSYFFARKFSPDCLRPLLDIVDDIIFGVRT